MWGIVENVGVWDQQWLKLIARFSITQLRNGGYCGGIYIHIYLYSYINMCVYVCTCVCLRLCICVFVRVCLYMCMDVDVHVISGFA